MNIQHANDSHSDAFIGVISINGQDVTHAAYAFDNEFSESEGEKILFLSALNSQDADGRLYPATGARIRLAPGNGLGENGDDADIDMAVLPAESTLWTRWIDTQIQSGVLVGG